ncbi:MAG: DUF3592 domain-containing protein [Anaerolineales bacterium]|nr:DUF3592 domain-containing protein [Anaerolineales bacterium]
MNLNALFGLIPSCIGILLVLLGAFFWFRTKSFIGKAQQAKGTIVDLQYDSDSDGSGYYSVFKFKTINGQEIQKTNSVRTNPPQHKVGQVIDVLYDPANANDARINSTTNLYFVPLLLGGMGFLFFCSGIAVVIFMGFFS